MSHVINVNNKSRRGTLQLDVTPRGITVKNVALTLSLVGHPCLTALQSKTNIGQNNRYCSDSPKAKVL